MNALIKMAATRLKKELNKGTKIDGASWYAMSSLDSSPGPRKSMTDRGLLRKNTRTGKTSLSRKGRGMLEHLKFPYGRPRDGSAGPSLFEKQRTRRAVADKLGLGKR